AAALVGEARVRPDDRRLDEGREGESIAHREGRGKDHARGDEPAGEAFDRFSRETDRGAEAQAAGLGPEGEGGGEGGEGFVALVEAPAPVLGIELEGAPGEGGAAAEVTEAGPAAAEEGNGGAVGSAERARRGRGSGTGPRHERSGCQEGQCETGERAHRRLLLSAFVGPGGLALGRGCLRRGCRRIAREEPLQLSDPALQRTCPLRLCGQLLLVPLLLLTERLDQHGRELRVGEREV